LSDLPHRDTDLIDTHQSSELQECEKVKKLLMTLSKKEAVGEGE
jgi:hypothetical protein